MVIRDRYIYFTGIQLLSDRSGMHAKLAGGSQDLWQHARVVCCKMQHYEHRRGEVRLQARDNLFERLDAAGRRTDHDNALC